MPPQEAAFENDLAVFCAEAAKRLGALGAGVHDTRRSLAEAGLLDAPPQAFLKAAFQLSPSHLRQLEGGLLSVPVTEPGLTGRPPSARASVGLFLLTAFAMVAREHANQGTLWPFVREHLGRKLPISSAVLPSLFDGGDAPSPCQLVKEMIRETVRHYPVRHAIGVEGKQQWYLTVHLQYGFSEKHFEDMGDRWLSGIGLPHSVELLLGEARLSGSDFFSDRFRRYWGVLRAFHHGELGLDRAQAEVVSLGWIGRERAARLLGAVAEFDQHFDSDRGGVALEPELLGLGDPLLWRPIGGAPVWLYDLQIPSQHPLHRDEYDVQVGARKVGSIYSKREPDGGRTWEGLAVSSGPQAALPPVLARVPLAMGPWREPALIADGLPVASGSFTLSEQQVLRTESPVVLVPSTVDPAIWEIWDGRGVVNQVALAVPPAFAAAKPSWTALSLPSTPAESGWRLWELKADLASGLRLTSDDQIVWEFEPADEGNRETDAITLSPTQEGMPAPDVLRLQLTGVPSVQLEGAWCAGLRLHVTDARMVDVPLRCFGDASVAIRLRLKVALPGGLAALHRTVHFPHPCLRVDSQSGLRRIDPRDVLHLSDFHTVRFWHPSGQDLYSDPDRLPYLFEGRRPTMPAKHLSSQRGYRLQGRLAGLGEPLLFGTDLIPYDEGRSRVKLSERVIACGILNGTPPDMDEACAGKRLLFEVEAEGVEPRPEWRIELLCQAGTVVPCSAHWVAELYLLGASGLDGLELPKLEDVLAARVVIDGCVRGRWERHDAFARLRGSPLSRWRLALEWELAVFPLNDPDSASLRTALLDSPGDFLEPVSVTARPWRVHPLGQPGLVQRELLKRLLSNATFEMAQAQRLCDAIADRRLKLPNADQERLVRSLVESASISPYLPYRLIEALQQDPDLQDPQVPQSWRSKTIKALRGKMTADAFLDFVLRDPDPLQPCRLRSPIAVAQVDAGFVDSTLTEVKNSLLDGQQPSPVHRENLDALCELTRTDARLARLAAAKFLE